MPYLPTGRLAACLLFLAGPAAAGSYSYTTLTPPGGVHDLHLGLNNANQVAGAYSDSRGMLRGFVWTHGKLVPAPFALDAIGDNGVAAGVNLLGGNGPEFVVALYDSATGHTNKLPQPVFTDGYVPNGDPFFVNSSGLVAGHARNHAGAVVGFLAHGARVIYVQPPNASETYPTGIDDAGAVVGMYLLPSLKWSNFVYSRGQYAEHTVPDSYTVTRFISGPLIGGDYRLSNGRHGFIEAGGNTKTLDYPNATSTSVANASATEAIGYYVDGAGVQHGFIHFGAAYYTIDPPGAASTDLRQVNADGSLAGFYKSQSGGTYAFIAICPPAHRPCTN